VTLQGFLRMATSIHVPQSRGEHVPLRWWVGSLLCFRALVLFVFIVAPVLAAEKQPFSFSDHVGSAVNRAGKICLNIHNAALKTGERVLLISTPLPQTFVEARIIGRATDECRDATDVDADPNRYKVQIVNGELPAAMPSIAVYAARGKLKRNGRYLVGDIDQDGHTESFRSCGSAEGLHLTVWTGPPLEGRLRWHHYYYLGYDIEPTCTEQDVRAVQR
jgi:hypothetical protein